MGSANNILVANIGSTSFKFRLIEMPGERVLARGTVERIGSPESTYSFTIGEEKVEGTASFPDYTDAIQAVESRLSGKVIDSFAELAAFGFKPVMANKVSGTQVMDEKVLKAMEDLITLMPAHNPPYINAVRAFTAAYPSIPCIGTFETAFYTELPAYNRRFPVPLEWEEKYGIQRTGFHGASHRFVTERAAELMNKPGARIISCHLGGSSSICAVRDGKAINSSWGMTAQSGLPQSNRVGDMDVFALIYLLKQEGMSLEKAEKALGSDAGLKGMSGLESGDIRDLRDAADSGNERAAEALAVYVASIRKYIGQFLVEMNGADAIVFTAGIGEHRSMLRAEILEGLDFAGIHLDAKANQSAVGEEACISTGDSKTHIWVIPTNEEIVIARNAWALLKDTAVAA
jgi:acetate kinase